MRCNGRTVMNPSKLRMSTGGSVRDGRTYTIERKMEEEEYNTQRTRGLDAIRYDNWILIRSTFVTWPVVIRVTVTL